MAKTLLQTKLYAPPLRPNLVLRPRLINRLNQGLRNGCQLSLVAAPAGYGKTVVVTSWLGQSGRRCAWLSLDEDDNDPVRFWSYVIAALEAAGLEWSGPASAVMTSPQAPNLAADLTGLVNALVALPLPVVLVLDDYHVIRNEVIHAGITFLLDHQPDQLHLVMATRADPPLPLARLRGRRALTEIRQGDLRFTAKEAGALLNDIMALALDTDEIKALAVRTEGWAVGLVLAAQSIQRRDHKQAFINAFSGSNRYILEYLIEEVLNDQSPAVRAFLLQISILTRFCGPLCDALTGSGDGQALLWQLQQANLFIIPLDAEDHWYRFHHLFADLLANLCRRELTPEQISELHRRASRWYEHNGALDDAVRHALLSSDFDLAAGLMERSAQSFIAQGRLVTLLNWLAALPDPLLAARPQLQIYRAWTLRLSGELETAERILQSARRSLQDSPADPKKAAMLGQIAAMLVGIATMDEDNETVIREARAALAALPENDLNSRARVANALGMALAYSDDFEQASATWAQGRDLALAAGNPFLAASAAELLAGSKIYHQGRLREGAEMLRQIVAWGTTEDGALLPFTAVAHALLGELHLEWNELETAAGYLEKAIELVRQGGIAYGLNHIYCVKARLSQALGDQEEASSALTIAGQALAHHPLWHMVVHQITCQVRFKLWLGDVSGAWRWAMAEPQLIGRQLADEQPVYLAEQQKVSQAKVLLAREQPAEALAILDGLLPGALATDRRARLVEIYLYRALALQELADFSRASDSFEQCLALAESERYVQLFIEAGHPVKALLRQATMRGMFVAYGGGLLAAFETAALDRPGTQQEPSPALVDPLSERELQVLRLIELGHSNRQIAETLVVSLNTVKKHSGSIYGKLGVHSRTQAVARARELDLI